MTPREVQDRLIISEAVNLEWIYRQAKIGHLLRADVIFGLAQLARAVDGTHPELPLIQYNEVLAAQRDARKALALSSGEASEADARLLDKSSRT